MLRGRMQHTAILPRGKSCSAYATNTIASTRKKNFLQTFFRLPKLWNKMANLVRFFSQTGWYHFETPYSSYVTRAASFDGTDNLPIEFLDHAASNSMPQPSRHNVYIYLWHGATFAARHCRTLPLCATRHSVDVPLCYTSASLHIIA